MENKAPNNKKSFAPVILVVVLMAIILFVIQLLTKKELNLGLFALAFAIPATANVLSAINTKSKKDTASAVVDSVIAIGLAVLHICL